MNVKRTSLGNRILSMLLVAVMVIGMIPATAIPAKAAQYALDSAEQTAISMGKMKAYAEGMLSKNFDTETIYKTGNKTYSWDSEGRDSGSSNKCKSPWFYYNGLMVEAMLQYGVTASVDENALSFAYDYFDYVLNSDGTQKSDQGDKRKDELDTIPPARVIAQLYGYNMSNDELYAKAIAYHYGNLNNNEVVEQYPTLGGNFKHKSGWNEWEIGQDGFYMAQPFLMETAAAMDRGLQISGADANTIRQKVAGRLLWVIENMCFTVTDGEKTYTLYHHGWDTDNSNNGKTPGNGVVWGRGTGWYAAGLVDVIELMPSGISLTYKNGDQTIEVADAKQALIKGLIPLFDGMLHYQDNATGMWYNVVYDNVNSQAGTAISDNYLETSGTALMAYALMKAYNNGWVGETYGNAGLKAFNGICDQKVAASTGGTSAGGYTVATILKTAGVTATTSPYMGSNPNDEAKGIGPLIMAAAQAPITSARVNGGSAPDEVFTAGVINKTSLSLNADGTVNKDGLKGTIVGNQGTIKDVSASDLTVSTTGVVSYQGNQIASVEITDPSMTSGSWTGVDFEAGATTYKRVTALTDAALASGVYICYNPGGESIMYNDNGTVKPLDDHVFAASGNVYTLEKLEASAHTWKIEPNGSYYKISADGKYLNGSSDGSLSIGTDPTTNWEIGSVSNGLWYIYFQDPSASADKPYNYLRRNSGSAFDIQEKKTLDDKPAGEGNKAAYFYAPVDSEVTTPVKWARLTSKPAAAADASGVEAAIKGVISIKVSDKSDGSGATALALDNTDLPVTYGTSVINGAGEYNVPVLVNGYEIGKVAVTVASGEAAPTTTAPTEPEETSAPTEPEASTPEEAAPTVTITPPTGVAGVGATSASVAAGTKFTLGTQLTNDDGYSLTWSSNNAQVASVDATSGEVTALSAGTATITATLTRLARAAGDPVVATYEVAVYGVTAAESTEEDWVAYDFTAGTGGGGTYTIEAITPKIDSKFTVSSAMSDRGDYYELTNNATITFEIKNSGTLTYEIATKAATASEGNMTIKNSEGTLIHTIEFSEKQAFVSPSSPINLNPGTYTIQNANKVGWIKSLTVTEQGGDPGDGTTNHWALLTEKTYAIPSGAYANDVELLEMVTGDLAIQMSAQETGHDDATAYNGTAATLTWDANGAPKATVEATTTYTATVTIPKKVNDVDTDTAVTLGKITVTVEAATVCAHTNTEIRNQKDATCGEAGYTGDTYCVDCGSLISSGSEIPATASHSYDNGVVTTQPSCTTEGVKTFTCSVCEHSYTENIAKLAHTEEMIPAVPASCTTTGLTEGKKCSVCNEILVAQTEVAKLAHNYGADGKCTVCGAEQYNGTDYKHNFTTDGNFTTEEAFFRPTPGSGGYDAPVKGADAWYDYYIVDGYTAYYKMDGTGTYIEFTAPADGSLVLLMKGRNQNGADESIVKVEYGTNTATYNVAKTPATTETLEGITSGQTVKVYASAGQPALFSIEFVPSTQYYLVGSEGLTGYVWDTTRNTMTDNGDGTYSIVFNDVSAGTHDYKVYDGTTWYGDQENGGNNYSFTTSCPADVTLTFDTNTKKVSRNVTLKHSYTSVVTAPTCTEGGYTTYTCACGDTYTADETAALGHDFNENNVCGNCQGTRVFLVPSNLWKSDNARFAVYYFVDDSNNGWYSMLDDDGDGVYEAVVPDGYATMMFVRMNPAYTTNNWDNDWNQTNNLNTPTDGKVYYTMPESWDGLDGTYWGEPPHVHEMTFVDPVGASCTVDGCNEHYTCSSCGKLFSDAEGQNETTLDALKIPATGVHTGGEATCKSHAVCSSCGQAYGELDGANHESSDFTYTDNADGTHKKRYACCNAVAAENEPHSFVNGTCVCDATQTATRPTVFTEVKTSTGDDTGKYTKITTVADLDSKGLNKEVIITLHQSEHWGLNAASASSVNGQKVVITGSGDNITIANDSEYTFPSKWTITKTNDAYTFSTEISGKTYYLSHNGTTLSLSEDNGADAKWKVGTASSFLTIYYEGGDKGYVTLGSKATTTLNDSNSVKEDNQNLVAIYAPVGGTTTEYYAISDITAAYDQNTTEDIAAAIRARLTLWKATNAAGDDAAKVALPENLTVDTSNVDVTKADTYDAIVKIGDTAIGTVKVTINAVDAPDVTYTYAIHGTVADTTVGGTPNFGNITVTKTGSDGSTHTFETEDLTFSTVDTSTAGEKTVTVTVDGQTFQLTFNVAESAGGLTVIAHPDTLTVPRHGYEEILLEVKLGDQTLEPGSYTITWTSEDTGVATVTQSADNKHGGIVYGVNTGNTVITATVVYTDANGDVYNGSATTTTTTTDTTTNVQSDPVQVGASLSGEDRTYNRVNTIAGLSAQDYTNGGVEAIMVFNQGSHWAADVSDSLTLPLQRMAEPTLVSGNTYKLATYSNAYTYAKRWVITKGVDTNTYYLSVVVGGKTYYLSHKDNALSFVETQSADCLWTARQNNNGSVSAITFFYMVDGRYYQLQRAKTVWELRTNQSSLSNSADRQIVLYVPNEAAGDAVYTNARVNGITSYVIEQGDTLTEAMILEHIRVELETSDKPGEWTPLAWTDSRINYNWRGVELDANTAGRYAMAIRVNNELVHRVFVTVEAAAYTVEISTADNASSVTMDNTLNATATVRDGNGAPIPDAAVTWSSANSNIARVDATTGVITGVDKGETDIIATCTIDGKTYTGVKRIAVTSKANYEKYIQNLTTEGFTDNLGFYTFSKNHNTGSADEIVYNGNDLNVFMKMETDTDIGFTPDVDGSLVVVAAKTTATVKLMNGDTKLTPTKTESTDTYTVYTFEGLTKDTAYTLEKDNDQALVAYWEFLPEGVQHDVYTVDVQLVDDQDELVVGENLATGVPTGGQATATVYKNGVATDETVTWSSEDPGIVEIDANGHYVAKGAGQTHIVATYTHTYEDGTTDTFIDRYLIFVLDGETITNATLSDNAVEFDLNQAVTKESFLDDSDAPITITFHKASGEDIEVALTDDAIDLGDLTTLTKVAGTKTVLVSYNGVAYLPISVRVVDRELDKHDGRVFQEVNVIYSLDIDGIDDGKEYVLVAMTEPPAEGSNTWQGVALLNPNDGTSNTKATVMKVTGDLASRTITFTGTAAEIADAKEFGLWLFEEQGADTDSYLIINNNRNFRRNSSYLTKADNDQNDAVTVEPYTAEGSYNFDLGSSNWLSYYEGAWVRTKSSSADATVYLFEKISETATVGVDFVSVTAPVQDEIHKGNTFTSVPTVHVSGVATTDYTIDWVSSDTSVATVDANGKVTYVGAGTATITATLTHIGGEKVTPNEGKTLVKEFSVTVPVETIELVVTPNVIVVPLNGKVDLSDVSIVRVRKTIVEGVVTEQTQETLDASGITFDLVGANNGNGIDTSVPGAQYQVETSYDGASQGYVTVQIGQTEFDGRQTATTYPQYPSGGAVRVDKTAVSAEGFTFSETGVSKVEISAAGVTQQSDIDVVLVVDVSNSMAWSMDWFEGKTPEQIEAAGDKDKLPVGKAEGTDKLDMAMKHASTFADILLEDGNNSLTFVTFAGCDTQNGGTDFDSVQTVFTGVTSADAAKTSFAGTRFTAMTGQDKITVTLQITDENGNADSGTNRGNTNYDYAFGQAISAVNDMKEKWEADESKNPNGLSYEESGRQIHVVFMTDGAPSHYNGTRNGGSTSDTIYGTSTKYSNKEYSNEDWTSYIKNPNTLATALYKTPGVTGFHTVGFDLAHGGFNKYEANATDMTYVLRGLVTSQDLDVVSAENEAQLQNFFESLAHSLTLAGRHAYVTDIVGADYTLYMGTELVSDTDGTAITGVPSDIHVKQYTLVTPTLIAQDKRFNESQIGQRVCDIEVDGKKIGEIEGDNVTTLETITFSNGVPTSSEIGALTVDADGGFKAKTFEYKVVDGKGNITWTIGEITHQEISLTYYAHLNGVAVNGARPADGTYFTNESAHITYIDAQEKTAVQEFPRPAMAFGSASIRIRFVLVAPDGRYANNMGNAFGSDIHANRVFATEEYLMNVTPNTVTTFDSELLTRIVNETGISAKYLPLVSSATFTVGNGDVEDKGLKILESSAPTTTPWGTGTDHVHNLETLLIATDRSGNGSYSQAIVEIPVVSLGGETAPNRLFTGSTVIDFGTPVDFEIAHEAEIKAFQDEGYMMTVVGFAPYSASFDQKTMIKPAQVGAGTRDMLATDSGVFSIKTAGDMDNNPVITFTPTAPMNGVQKVFATIRFSVPGEETTSYYYMYKEINVIPATMQLVESDATVNASGLGYVAKDSSSGTGNYQTTTREFATGFTYTGAWQQLTSGTISNQNTNPEADAKYGFDTGYANFQNFAGNVMYVNNTAPGNMPTVKFSFTGTGFDLISRTGADQGMISVVVSRNGTEVKRQVIVLKSQDELYQIPVTSIEGLEYGTYDVVISVNSAFKIGSVEMGGQFYFDGIRVYNAAMNDAAAIAAYKAAGENNMMLQEIRELLLAADSFGGGLVEGIKGALYFDGNDLSDGVTPEGETLVSSYEKIGPKNEIYLSGGQAVAFKLGFTGELPTTLDIGLKLAKGNSAAATITIYNATDIAARQVTTNVTLQTATAMFYNILGTEQLSSLVDGNNEIIVVISYGSDANLNDILSITDLKAGFNADAVGRFEVISSTETVAAASLTLNPEFNVKSAQFEADRLVAMQNATLTVVTSAGVDSILVTDEEGKEVGVAADFMDTADGDRVWTILVRPTASGKQTFTVTGVGADGQTGESATITATVNLC